jgi:hypothetical protein
LKFPAESIIWDGIFMGFAPNKVGDGINTALLHAYQVKAAR